jgi:hypothetical protein
LGFEPRERETKEAARVMAVMAVVESAATNYLR